jgi:glycine/D-amino acid oxidase-like deaminating enzyme
MLIGDRTVDVAIIGAGYTGLSAALHCAPHGGSVAVLEAAEIGYGASGRNNGQVIPNLSRADPDGIVAAFGADHGERFVRMMVGSADFLFNLVREHGINCEAVQNGWVQPAHSPGRAGLAASRVEQWARRGAPVRLLDRRQAADLLGTEAYFGGWINMTGGHINPLGYARGLARAALTKGVRIFTRSPAQSIERIGGSWRIRTPQGGLTADQILIATNAYSDDLWRGLRASMVRIKSYQAATAPLSDNLRSTVLPGNHAVSDTRRDLRFFRYDKDGRLVTGGALVLPILERERLTPLIRRRLAETFPQLGGIQIQRFWSGLLSITRDAVPHLHELGPGAYSWIGCNGRGIALSTALGPALADALRGLPLKDLPIPVTPLRPLPTPAILDAVARGMLALYRRRDRQEIREQV